MLDYDRLAEDYARHRQVHPGVVKDLWETGGIGPQSSVLEVGCGTGNYVAALEQLAGAQCTGIDPSREMLDAARRQTSKVSLGIGSAEKLDFPDDSFDLVFSVDVIHHVEGRPAFYNEARRVLKPGGRVCTATDSEWIIRHRRPLSEYFPETVEREIARYPRIAELREQMAAAGFDAVCEHQVEFAYERSDIGPYESKAYSTLHLIPEDAFQRGLTRLREALQAGPIQCVSYYVLLWGTA